MIVEGRLSYNQDTDRFGLLVSGEWVCDGLHCGQCLEVIVDDVWTPTRLEMDTTGLWYLVETPYVAHLDYIRARMCI